MKKRIKVILIIAAILIVTPYLVTMFEPWSEINCQHQDINIKTGQVRYSNYFWYVKTSERTEETTLSILLKGEKINVAEIKEWHHVNTFSPGTHHSPHYLFHGALSQANELEMLASEFNLTNKRKQEIVKKVMTLWQENGSTATASDYLMDYSNFTSTEQK